MRIPGIGKLTTEKAQNKAFKMLKKAGLRKSKNVIMAEYKDYCTQSKPSARDKTGFLSVMGRIGDDEAKAWVEQERTRLDKIIEKEDKKNEK